MLLYILVTFVIVFYLLLTAYIRIKMNFWHLQPVFHIYNLRYWCGPPGLIQKEPPIGNKFVNIINVKVFKVEEQASAVQQQASQASAVQQQASAVQQQASAVQQQALALTAPLKARACQLIRQHFVRTAGVSYAPTQENILNYLANNEAYMALYLQPKILFDKTEPVQNYENVLGVITARILRVQRKSTREAFKLYYIDHLCVKSDQRRKGMAPQLIQTLYYTISRSNPRVNIYLFKREGQLNAIVPLVVFDTSCFVVNTIRALRLHAAYQCILVGEGQMALVLDFLTQQRQRFEWSILMDLAVMTTLIKTEEIFLYALTCQGKIKALYAIRNTPLFYRRQTLTLDCFCVVTSLTGKDAATILLSGFFMVTDYLKNKQKIEVQNILIEETADASVLVQQLPQPPLFVNKTAFFFYNYATYSCKNKDVLLMY